MALYTLIIMGKLPGLNEYTKATRRNRYKGAGMKRDAQAPIIAAARAQLKGVTIRPPVVIKYLWVEPDRRRDCDNVAFAKKFVQDALVKAGALPNDSQKYIVGFTDDFAVDNHRPRVEVTIEEVEAWY